jgi:hypothetical protein
MWGFAIAMAILAWLWGSAGNILVGRFKGRVTPPVLAAWLALALVAGIAGLLAMAWLLLPDSYISRGWTREMLEQARQLSAVFVLVAGAAAYASGWRQLSQAPDATGINGLQKRRVRS